MAIRTEDFYTKVSKRRLLKKLLNKLSFDCVLFGLATLAFVWRAMSTRRRDSGRMRTGTWAVSLGFGLLFARSVAGSRSTAGTWESIAASAILIIGAVMLLQNGVLDRRKH